MTPNTSRILRTAVTAVLAAAALAACTARPSVPADTGTTKFVADTLAAKGVRP